MFQDVTEKLKAEHERLKLQKLESVGLLAGGIAHNFNNLFTVIFGNIELAKLLLSSDHEAFNFLESAEKSMDRATKLTKQLLTFAKGGDPIKELISINEIVLKTAKLSIRGPNIKLKCDMSQDLWPISADKNQMSQVIRYILINAEQSMPTGGTISITTKNDNSKAGQFVQITIQDEGVGIASNNLHKIFDPYFTTKEKGSGLGLAITHSIITKHNGRIKVDSVINQGTIFTIYLPAVEQAVEQITKKKSTTTATVPDKTIRILVLDDEKLIRKVLGAMLRKLDYEEIEQLEMVIAECLT